MGRLSLAAAGMLILLAGVSASGVARDTPIGFELYSWPERRGWSFAVFEGTSTMRSADTILSRRNALKGIRMLKGRLATLPNGEQVYWRERRTEGLPLPSKETIHELSEFCDGAGLKLILPDDPSLAK